MPAFTPCPQALEYLIVQIFKRSCRHVKSLVICPTANHRIQFANQPFLLDGWIFFNGAADFIQNPFQVFLRRFYQQFAIIFPNIASKKIKSLINMGNNCLCFRKLQPAFRHKITDNGKHLFLQQFAVFTGNNKIIGKSHIVDNWRIIFAVSPDLMELLFENCLKSIQHHIAYGRRDRRTLRRTFFGGE